MPTIDRDSDVGFNPAASVPPLTAQQLLLLRQLGEHWRATVTARPSWRRALPVATDLAAVPPKPAGRFTPVAFITGEGAGEVTATDIALEPETAAGQLFGVLRRLLIGAPLRTAAVAHERMRKLVALAVLSSDALSSVAYGPEAMLTVLAAAGATALGIALPIALAITVLMLTVGLSYRQTIKAYPGGGGSYIVATANLGELPGLFAAAGLMIDYVLTVAVSVAAGIDAVTSAIPSLHAATVPLGVGVIGVLLLGNLRGVREAGALFAWPTYAFILGMAMIVVVGLIDAAGRGFSPTSPPAIHGTEGLGVLLVLRAFASGSTAMTGIEAISNAVPAFKPPAWRNARTTLSWMIGLLIAMFAGVVLLVHFDGIAPRNGQTVLSQLAHRSLGSGALYGYFQAATALVLMLAANAAFNGFPRLLYFMARDARAPSVFLRVGDRLAFSNGIILLAVIAAATFTALSGKTESLIPLYAVGVFLAFTLSQLGMVVHWLRLRDAHWRKSIAFNTVGCFLSAIVLVISAVTKFTEGAWLVVIAVPVLVLIFTRIRAFYRMVDDAVALRPINAPPSSDAHHGRLGPGSGRKTAVPAEPLPESGELGESPEELRHLAIVPILALDLASMRALAYAASLSQPVLAVHISPNDIEAKRFEEYWRVWGDHLPLEVIVSPYRAIVVPLGRYIDALHNQRPDMTFTIVLPELIPRHGWQRLLQDGVASRLRRNLRHQPRIVVTTVPFVLPG